MTAWTRGKAAGLAPQVRLADIMQRAGFVPENADGTPWAAHAHARHGDETALPPAFQEPGAKPNPAGSMAGYSNGAVRMTPQGMPAGAGVGAGFAAPSSSEGLGIGAAGEPRSSRAASAPTGAGDATPLTGAYGAPGSEPGGGRAPPAAAPSLNGTGLSGPAADAGPVPSTVAASRNGAGQGSSVRSASENGAGQNETAYGSGAGGAVSAEALELGAAAAAAPSSANAVRGCASQAEAVWERIGGVHELISRSYTFCASVLSVSHVRRPAQHRKQRCGVQG